MKTIIVIMTETTVSDYSKTITATKMEILKYFGTIRAEIEDNPSPVICVSGEVVPDDINYLHRICDAHITLLAIISEESNLDGIEHIIKL
jgi:hypothetical protein